MSEASNPHLERYARLQRRVERQLQELGVSRTVAASANESYERAGLDHLSPWAKRSLQRLLKAEHGAWVLAHGSTALRASLSDKGFADGQQFVAEWLSLGVSSHLAHERVRNPEFQQGALYERRLPGSHLITRFLVAPEGADTPATWLDAFAGGANNAFHHDRFARMRPMVQWLADRAEKAAIEQARGMTVPANVDTSVVARACAFLGIDTSQGEKAAEPRAQTFAFVGVEKSTARFLVEIDGRKRLQSFALTDGAEAWGREAIAELNMLAVPPAEASRIMARYALVERLESQYKLPVRTVDREVVGRVDKILTTAAGAKRAVIVGERSVHIVNLRDDQARDPRSLLGQRVGITRGDHGLGIWVGASRGGALRAAEQAHEWVRW
ncbi:MAG TPA: hypothetical protein VMF89_18515 [Polyangiales bacterium]|nr:hypothetical protein [Polyangiales bacterium]